jgi:hypothetical protein
MKFEMFIAIQSSIAYVGVFTWQSIMETNRHSAIVIQTNWIASMYYELTIEEINPICYLLKILQKIFDTNESTSQI